MLIGNIRQRHQAKAKRKQNEGMGMALSEKAKRLRAQTLCEIGQHLYREGEVEEAMNYFQRSLELHPSIDGHMGLAEVYEHFGLTEEAIEECKKAMELDYSNVQPYTKLVYLYAELDDYDTAEAWAHQGLEAVEKKSPLYHSLGRIYEQKGRWIEAINAYNRAFAADRNFFVALVASMRLRAKFN